MRSFPHTPPPSQNFRLVDVTSGRRDPHDGDRACVIIMSRPDAKAVVQFYNEETLKKVSVPHIRVLHEKPLKSRNYEAEQGGDGSLAVSNSR